MSRIVCDPSSGSIELYLTEIIRSCSLMFVVCLISVWQRNFELVVCVCVCVCTVQRDGAARCTHTHARARAHTHTHTTIVKMVDEVDLQLEVLLIRY